MSPEEYEILFGEPAPTMLTRSRFTIPELASNDRFSIAGDDPFGSTTSAGGDPIGRTTSRSTSWLAGRLPSGSHDWRAFRPWMPWISLALFGLIVMAPLLVSLT